MPRKPIDYSKTIMYRIVCKNPEIEECYVGSTTDFKSRKKTHKSYANNIKCNIKNPQYNYYVYQFIREHNGWNNWDILEIEKYNAKDQPDQAKRERFWLEFYNATLNSSIPSRDYKEYNDKNKELRQENYNQNKEFVKNQSKNYYDKNKEQIRKYREEKITCECGSICMRTDIARHKKTKKHQLLLLNISSNNLC